MKVLVCRECCDLFKLDYNLRSCKCGLAQGNYLPDGDRAVYNGKGVMLGIGNHALASMLGGGDCMAELFIYPIDNGKITVDERLGSC